MAGRWMTYVEAGERFSLSPEAIRKRSRRLGWEVEPANSPHGKTRILVPDDAMLQLQQPPGRPDAPPPGDRIGHVRTDELAEARLQLAVLQVDRDAERRRADAAEARLATMENQVSEARALADQRAVAVAEAREQVGRAEAGRDAAVAAAQGRQAVAEGELAAWTEGGPLARALRALLWRRG